MDVRRGDVLTDDVLIDKAFGCLIAGLIGDAMGTPTGRGPGQEASA